MGAGGWVFGTRLKATTWFALSRSTALSVSVWLAVANQWGTYDSARLSYEMHTPARFSYELHRSESGVVREWCSPAHLRRAERGALHRAAGSRRRASGIVRDDGRLAMSISAHAARSISAVGCRKSDWLTTAFCRLSGGRVHVVWSVACT